MTDVVHVISGLGRGGAETMLAQLAGALRARGLAQHVVSLTPQNALAADIRAAGVDLTMLKAGSLASLTGAAAALTGLVGRLRPRVLQGWMYHGNLAATLAHYLAAGRHGRKLMWNLRASNMDAARYGAVIKVGALLSSLPYAVIANSQAGADFHRARGFRPKRMDVIDNGIDTQRFRPDPAARGRVRMELGIPADAVVVVHVARVDPMKDQATFLAAMAGLPALTAVMVGNGTNGLTAPNNVLALGMRNDTEALYAAADIVASTSAFGEGFSNVLAEGMSAGLVPVTTDVGDARRIVGDVGTIVAPRDPRTFVAAVREIAALSNVERQRRGLAARERIVANFTLARAADAFARLYAAG